MICFGAFQITPVQAENGLSKLVELELRTHKDVSKLVPIFFQQRHESQLARKIELSHEALKYLNMVESPHLWASTNEQLGMDYYQSLYTNISTDKIPIYVDNAIYYYEQSLTIYTANRFPKARATIQKDVANLYWQRKKGTAEQNVESSIWYTNEALKYFTPQNYPRVWAGLKHTLLIAYSKRVRGNREQNLREAIKHGKQGLQVITRDKYPNDWARLNHDVEKTYRDLEYLQFKLTPDYKK